MELDLKHLGQTIAIGSFVFYSILLLLKLCRPNRNYNFLNSHQANISLQEMIVYLALVFGIGIVLEDVSKNVTAQRDSLWGFGEIINDYALDSDSEIRLRSLFTVESFSESKAELNKTPIFNEIIKLKKEENKINDIVDSHIKTLESILNKHITYKEVNGENKEFSIVEGKEDIKNLKVSVNGIYYSSKNSVYRDPQYYNELSEIQSRIDFTGALTFLCVVFFLVYFAIGFIKFLLATPIKNWIMKILMQKRTRSRNINALLIRTSFHNSRTPTSYRSIKRYIESYRSAKQPARKRNSDEIFCLKTLGILLLSLVFWLESN